MEFGSQDLSFGDFSSLSPEEHDKVYTILHRSRGNLARKVEFPWDNMEQVSRETLTVNPAELEHGGPILTEEKFLSQDGPLDPVNDFGQMHGGSMSLDQAVAVNCVVTPDFSNVNDAYTCGDSTNPEGTSGDPSGSGSSGSARGSIDRSREATPTDSNDGNSDTGDSRNREKNSGRLMASLKTYERRNKKKRPPDYYERLAEEEHIRRTDNMGYTPHLEDSGYSEGPACGQHMDASPRGHQPPVMGAPMVMPGGPYPGMVPMFGVPPGYSIPGFPMHPQGMSIMAGHHMQQQQQHGLVGMPPHTQMSSPMMSNHMSGPPPLNQMSHPPPPSQMSGPPSRHNMSGPTLRVQMAPPHPANRMSSQLPPNQMSGPRHQNQITSSSPRNQMIGPSSRNQMSGHVSPNQMSSPIHPNQMSGPDHTSPLSEPPHPKHMSEPSQLSASHGKNMSDSHQQNQVHVTHQQSQMYAQPPPHHTPGQAGISSPPGLLPIEVMKHQGQTIQHISPAAEQRRDRHPPGFVIRPPVVETVVHTVIPEPVVSTAHENQPVRITNTPPHDTATEGHRASQPPVDTCNPFIAEPAVSGMHHKSPPPAQFTYARDTGTTRVFVQAKSNNSKVDSATIKEDSLGNTESEISEDQPQRTSGNTYSSETSILADRESETLTFLQEDTVMINDNSLATEPKSPDLKEDNRVSDGMVHQNIAKSENSDLLGGTDSQPPVVVAPIAEPVNKPKVASWAGLFKSPGSSRPPAVSSAISGASSVGSALSNNFPDNNKQSDVSGEIQPPVPASEDSAAKHLGELLFQYGTSFVSTPLQPRGLMNRGNWCYVNATLQALLACPAFNNLLKQLPTFPALTRGPSSTPILDSLVEFVNEFTLMQLRPVEKMDKGKKKIVSQELVPGSPFEPSYVYKMLQVMESSSSFKGGKQEDAEEFLSCVLNGVHEEMAAAMSQVSDKHKQISLNNEVEVDATNGYLFNERLAPDEKDDQWEQVGPRNKSVFTRKANFAKTPISDIFAGQIRSAVFQAGSRESAMLEPFFTLQLDIQSEKVWTVKDALDGLVSKENVQGFTCSKTKTEVEVTRRLTLEELPPVLVLHLKFFVYDKSGGCQKLLKKIDYATELEISKDLLSPNVRSKLPTNQRMYKLFAVVYHHGKNVTGGHYTTDVYHSGVNSWVHIDDSNVKQVNLQQVLKFVSPRVPYLLYYRRLDLT